MSRAFSSSALKALYAEETGDFPILLITITAATLSTPIRVSSDPTQRLIETDQNIIYGTMSRSNSFYYVPFSIALPTDMADAAAQTTITIDNVGRDLISAVRSLQSPPDVTMELVMASAPDTVEATYPQFKLSKIGYDVMSITGTLTVDMLVTEPFPAGNFNPSQFPGLF